MQKFKVILRSARAGVEFEIPDGLEFVEVVHYDKTSHEAHILVTVT